MEADNFSELVAECYGLSVLRRKDGAMLTWFNHTKDHYLYKTLTETADIRYNGTMHNGGMIYGPVEFEDNENASPFVAAVKLLGNL